MEDTDKLVILLDHWIEHNASHREEFEKWAKRAEEANLAVSGDIAAAAERLQDADDCLRRALNKLRPQIQL